MAFNPFSAFRKHRKVGFALLTIFVMFIFILTGTGAAVDPLFALLDGRSSRDPEVARLDGSRVRLTDVQQVRVHRRIANEYITRLTSAAVEQSFAAARNRVKEMDAMAGGLVNQVIRARDTNPMIYFQEMQRNTELFNTIASRMEQDKKTDDANFLRNIRRAMLLEMQLLNLRFRGGLYFGGSLQTGQDILDFMAWRWAADQRGITLTPDLVAQTVREETLGADIDSNAIEVQKDLVKRYKISVATIIECLADEFRVRITQTAMLGAAPQLPNSMPAYVTPHEFFKFFQDNRTEVRVQLMPLPVESFVSKVTETPAETELSELFKKHKSDEWSPFSEQPGFKQSRKVKIEWVGLTGDPPAIKQAALEQAAKDSQLAQAVTRALFAPPAADFAGVLGYLGAASLVNDPKLIDRRIDQEYEEYVKNERVLSWHYQALFSFGLHDRSAYNPAAIATGVAAMLAGSGTGLTPLNTYAAWGSQSIVQELRDRMGIGLQPFALSGDTPQALFGAFMLTPSPLPRDAVADQLREKVTGAVVRDFLNREMNRFQEEVAAKGKNIKKPGVQEELTKFIDEFVKKYGLTRGASQEFQDRFQLINDPGLVSLKEAYIKDETNKTDVKGHNFGLTFFADPSSTFSSGAPYRVTWFGGRDPASPAFAKPDDRYYMVWKTEETPARERKFEEARADVEHAWRLAKARELAQKEAESLQKRVREQAINSLAALKDFAAQHKHDLIEIGPMAKLNEQPSFQPNQAVNYRPPVIPAEKVAYPTQDFATQLVDLRDKPIGESIVLHDAPKATYFVAVLTERIEPSDFAFQQSYARAAGDGLFGSGRDPMLMMFENERREKLFVSTLEQLRQDARVVASEELKRLDERAGSDE